MIHVLMRTDEKNPDGRELYRRFLECCQRDERTSGLMMRYFIAGCRKQLLFECLRRYVENPADLDRLTASVEKGERHILRRAARDGGTPSFRSVILSLHDRLDHIRGRKRMGYAHCTESLVWLEVYLEVKTGSAPSPEDLVLLVDAINLTLGRAHRKEPVASADALRKELRRFKQRLPDYAGKARLQITTQYL
jgi:hypothetical protein